MCIITILLTLRFVPALAKDVPTRFDFCGFAMVGVSLVLFQLGVEHLARPSWGTAGTIAISVFYARMSRGRDGAALDLSLFSIRALRSA